MASLSLLYDSACSLSEWLSAWKATINVALLCMLAFTAIPLPSGSFHMHSASVLPSDEANSIHIPLHVPPVCVSVGGGEGGQKHPPFPIQLLLHISPSSSL